MVIGASDPTTEEILVKRTTDVSQSIQCLWVMAKVGALTLVDEQKLALKH